MAFNDGSDMKLRFLVAGKEVSPPMGILSGYIQEGINQVTAIELFTVSKIDYTDEEIEQEFLNKSTTITMSTFIDGDEFISRYDGVIFEADKPDSIHLGPDVFLYRLTIRPEFWNLAVSNHSASFPQMSRIQVIEEVLQENDFVKDITYETALVNEESYPKLPQILQCETSDMAFVQRLMREAGINYYFTPSEKEEMGEKKKGAEILRIVNNSGFFKTVFPHSLIWNPAAGMTNKRRISTFETSIRTVPAVVESTASFGEGSTQVYASSESPNNGTGGTFRDFSSEGQSDAVARNNAKLLKERFESRRVAYNAKSNHFCIRAGERFTVTGPRLDKDKEILVTSVRHSFSQTVNAALAEQGASTPTYSNTFTAVGKETEFRPQKNTTNINAKIDIVKNQVLVDLVAKLNVAVKAKLDVDLGLDINNNLDLIFSPDVDLNMYHFELVNNLIQSCDTFGVHVGLVTSDTVVNGGEMTCEVKSDHYGVVTAKVGTGWLVPGGGLTLFPRAGMQVFFVLLQGNMSEGVIVGYRPSSSVPGQDPAGSTTINSLQTGGVPTAGSPPPQVVSPSSFSTSNRQLLAIRGEGGVAQVAVIDGGKDSVTVSANADIYETAGGAHHVSCGTDFLHSVGGAMWQNVAGDVNIGVHGSLNEAVTGDKTATVAGDQIKTIKGNQTKTIEKESTITVIGNWFKKHSSETHEIKISNTLAANFSNETKSTVGIFNEFKAAMTTSIVVGTNLTISKTKDVKIVKEDGNQIVKKDQTVKIGGKWTTEVAKEVKLKAKSDISSICTGKHKIYASKDINLKSTQGNINIDAKSDVAMKGDCVLVDAKRNIVLKVGSNKWAIKPSGIDGKGSLIKFG